MNNKLFKEELDKITQEEWHKIHELIVSNCSNVISIRFEIKLPDSILEQFWLNKNLRFIITASVGDMVIEFNYKGRKIDPVNYYLRPNEYHEVSMLQILQQCIIQDTHSPDIMFLERGEICMRTKRHVEISEIL
jgi:hypothetical protein